MSNLHPYFDDKKSLPPRPSTNTAAYKAAVEGMKTLIRQNREALEKYNKDHPSLNHNVR